MKRRKVWVLNVMFLLSLVILGWNFYSQIRKILAQLPTSWTQDQTADCAVVLTGSQGRVREGFDLLSQKMVRKLVISGVHPQAPMREIFPQWPFYGDLSEEDVVLERRSQTTWGNAQQTLPVVEALNCKSVLLVTSRLHSFRAINTFRAVYPKEIPVEARVLAAGGALLWQDIGLEALKSLFYSLWAY